MERARGWGKRAVRAESIKAEGCSEEALVHFR